MNNIVRLILLSIVVQSWSDTALSENMIGSLISYQCEGKGTLPNSNNYKISLKIFYDCASDETYAPTVILGIYKGTGENYTFHSKVTAGIELNYTSHQASGSCVSLITQDCMRTVMYTTVVRDLPLISENYLISYERCCRPAMVSNIVDPGHIGTTAMLIFTPEAQRACSSSPQFDQDLTLLTCLQEDFLLDLRASIVDQDLITYELCAPLTGGGSIGLFGIPGNPMMCDGILPDPASCLPSFTEVTFVNTQLSDQIPFPSSIPITLVQGMLRARPTTKGHFVFGICIKVFRGGLLLSIQRIDLQIKVTACDIHLKADIISSKVEAGIHIVKICDLSSPVKITNTSQDSAFIKKVKWEFTSPSGVKIIDSTFHFVKKLNDTGLYNGIMYINPGYSCSDSINVKLLVNPLNNAPMLYVDYDSCSLSKVSITISPGDADYLLDYGDSIKDTILKGDKVSPHFYNHPGAYTLTASSIPGNDVYCTQLVKKTIRLYTTPLVDNLHIRDTIICYPGNFLLATREVLDTSFRYTWMLSDGRSFSGIKANIFFTAPDHQKISLTAYSAPGCKSVKQFETDIFPSSKPKADFDILNVRLSFKNPMLELVNNSNGAESFRWDFGDQVYSDDFSPLHTYLSQGIFKVTLYAANRSGCIDSLSQLITVDVSPDLYVPNIFTPNGDGQNDLFLPILTTNYSGYEMNIYNRWGGLVYTGSENSLGWDGFDKAGHSVPIGVYIYKLRLYSSSLPAKVIYGSISLLK